MFECCGERFCIPRTVLLFRIQHEVEFKGGFRNHAGVRGEHQTQLENIGFPFAQILEDDGEVKIYYGASDTVECLATARVEDLIALCKPL